MKKKYAITCMLHLLIVFFSINKIYAQDKIATFTLKEKEGVTSQNYPLLFGLPIPKGSVNSTTESISIKVNDVALITQFDIKTTWDDGSVKFGVISTIIPSITANSELSLELIVTNALENAANSGFLSVGDIQSRTEESLITLSSIAGNGISTDLMGSLQTALNSKADYWLKGSVTTEVLTEMQLHNSVRAKWEARYFPQTNYGVRVSNIVEHVFLDYMGALSYNATIESGNVGSLEENFNSGVLDHAYGSRWKKTYWIGNEPPETELHYDLEYLVSTGLIMPYGTQTEISETTISEQHNSWLGKSIGINGNGFLTKYFPQTGGRPEIGVLPRWSALYLSSFDNRMKEIVLGNGEMGAHIPAHMIETNTSSSFNNHIVSLDDRPSILRFGDATFIGDSNSNGWTVDLSHQGSFSYLPYLITGEHFYLEEIMFWAAYSLNYQEYRREGSQGLIYGQTRGFAWSLRTIGHAATIVPDDFIEKPYFNEKLINNINHTIQRNLVDNPSALHQFSNYREHGDGAPYTGGFTSNSAPWQHDFIILVFSDLIRQGYTSLEPLRDYLGEFTVGRFTNDPDFPKYGGAGYWWPLRDADDNFATSWGDFWNDVKVYEGKPDNYIPTEQDMIDTQDYPFSYAYVARAAISMLTHLNKGPEAYDLLETTFNTNSNFSEDPTWGFYPLSGSTINPNPDIIRVGSTRLYKSPYELYTANILQDGDIVEIDAETYTGQSSLIVWDKNNLTIRGIDGRPHMNADGQNISGKGTWVLTGNNINIENIEFSGAAVPDRNGAGIRLDGIGLTVKKCYFHDNENGILTSNSGDGDILVEYSEFNNNGYGDGFTHNLYIGRVASLTFQFNYSHHAKVGHNLKSRAAKNYVYYNRIMDEESGNSSRLIDISNGGFSVIMGNLLMQGNLTENSNIVGYGAEGLEDVANELYIINNTFVNKRIGGATFISIASGTSVSNVSNNIFGGNGTVISGTTSTMNNNHVSPDIGSIGFEDEPNYDYHLNSNSPAKDIGTSINSTGNISLTPVFSYKHKSNRESRALMNGIIDIGAYEFDAIIDTDEDADNDGIADIIDNCPQSANTNQNDNDNDGVGDICDDDDDNDGVLDINDDCPFVAGGVNGCVTVSIPEDAITILTKTPTCPGEPNGVIDISSSVTTYNYNINISGQGKNQDFIDVSLGNSVVLNDLNSGIYEVSVAIPSIDFEQIYGVIINEISEITAQRQQIKNDNRAVVYKVSGSNEYLVNVNDFTQTYSFNSNDENLIILNNLEVSNTIIISGEKECQGKIIDNFTLPEDLIVYPTVTSNRINISNTYNNDIQVKVYTSEGRLVLEKSFNTNEEKSINLIGKANGIYIVHVINEDIIESIKVIKK